MEKDISVIMPALNEQDNIEDAIRNTLYAFNKFSLKGEVVVVNDGSIDNTATVVNALIAQIGSKNIKLVEHESRKGIGVCFKDGLKEASGRSVVLLPGDNENDPAEVLRYAGLLDNVDMVVPFIYNKAEARGFIRNLISGIFCFIINKTFGQSFKYHNGTTIYRRVILTDVGYKSTGFFFQAELLTRLAKKGYLFAEVPCSLGKREKGSSKALSFSSLLKVIKGYMLLLKDIYFSKDFYKHGMPAQDSITYKRLYS